MKAPFKEPKVRTVMLQVFKQSRDALRPVADEFGCQTELEADRWDTVHADIHVHVVLPWTSPEALESIRGPGRLDRTCARVDPAHGEVGEVLPCLRQP